MSEQLSVIVCKRCGSGFIPSSNYCDWLARRGVRVNRPMLCLTCFIKEGPLLKQKGVVKWFNPRRRYGFIDVEQGEDIFFHQRQIVWNAEEKAHEGQAARFHVRQAEKGPEALNVELLG